MSDLRLTDAAVTSLRGDLRCVADDLSTARRRLGGHDTAALGAPKLVRRLEDFSDDWNYGLGKLADQVATASADLDVIEKTFADVDTKLSESCR